MNLRVPPHNLEAEMSVLAGLMLDSSAWDVVQDILNADDFYKLAHQKIYSTVRDLFGTGSAVDLVTVTHELRHRGELEQVGGSAYLGEMINYSLGSANIGRYAEIIREQALLRRLIHVNTDIIEKTYSGDFIDVNSHLDEAEGAVLSVAGQKRTAGLEKSQNIVHGAIKKIEELYHRKADITGVATGFTRMDEMTSGFQPGELIIIAARPSMGKTAFSLNIATHVALREKKKVAYFSIEMNKEQIMMRVLASEARIHMSDIRKGKIEDTAWEKLIRAATNISEASLYIDDSSSLSPYDVRAKCRRMQKEHGLDLIMIDYLQLMELKREAESRERAISEISSTLKKIAKELNVPVVALAQLNRGVEGRSDRRPILSDLRESGSIEQDADVIMMIYRDEYYTKENSDQKGRATIIIGKQRNGPTGDVDLAFVGQYGTFANLTVADSAKYVAEPTEAVPQYKQAQRQPGEKPKNFAVREPGPNL